MNIRTARPLRRRQALLIAAFVALLSGALLASPAAAQDKPSVAVTGIDLAADTVEITNSGDAEVDVNGLILCNFPVYVPIADAPTIAAGETITVDAGALGVALDDAQGELGIYTVGEFENPDALVSYVEWGQAGHERSPVAVEAGVWDGEFVPAGSTLTSNVDFPTAAANWSSDGGATALAATGAESSLVFLTGLALLAMAAVVGGRTLILRRRLERSH